MLCIKFFQNVRYKLIVRCKPKAYESISNLNCVNNTITTSIKDIKSTFNFSYFFNRYFWTYIVLCPPFFGRLFNIRWFFDWHWLFVRLFIWHTELWKYYDKNMINSAGIIIKTNFPIINQSKNINPIFINLIKYNNFYHMKSNIFIIL